MYMVDNEEYKENCFGYTNKDGTVEYVKYDKSNEMVIVGVEDEGDGNFWYYPEDISNLIKALEHMQKYLVDEGIIK